MPQYTPRETAKNLNVAPQTLKRWRTTGTQPRSTPQRREQFIQDLQDFYELAVEKGNFVAALRAKELLGKEAGFFNTRKTVMRFMDPSLEKLSDENLNNFLEFLNKKMEEKEAAGMGETA